MATPRNLVRIQEKGQVTLPAPIRERLGLKKGDLVSVTETPDGILIRPQAVVAVKTLHKIGDILGEKGITIEEMEDAIESAREQRLELLKELHGIDLTQ